MAKRFTDSNKFNDPWYRRLSPKHKCLWEYLLAECNHAGLLKNLDFERMTFQIGEEITQEDIKIFDGRLIFVNKEILFIPKFIEFQYSELNPESRVHSSIIKELEKFNLYKKLKGIDRVSTGYLKGIDTLKDKEKDKDKDKDKDKEKEVSSLVLSSLPEDMKIYGKYHNVCMSVEQYNKLLGICASQKLLDELVNNLSENIKQGTEHSFRSDYPNTHFVRLQKYRKYRLDNPDKFPPHKQTEKSEVGEIVDKWYNEMKERGYGE